MARISWHPFWALVAIGGLLPLVVAAWVGWHLFRPLPSDDHLRRRFHDHWGELDRLVALAQADTQLVGAGHDWMLMRFTVFVHDTPRFDRLLTDAEARASGRLEFRRLLDRVGLPSLSRSVEGKAIWFVAGSSGGARKGLVYSETPLGPTRSSLDRIERVSRTYIRSGYVPLAPRWFMFLEPRD